MSNTQIFTATDFYKVDHRNQYPKGTETIYSNFTPRTTRRPGTNAVVFFGLQYFVKEYLIRRFNEDFFNVPESVAVARYKRRLDTSLGKDAVAVDHVRQLHRLGYLPLVIKALPEGDLVPLQVPAFTVENTVPEFFWLTNFIETLVSATVWGPCTSATTAFTYRKNFEKYAAETGAPAAFIPWQGHDFSFRGMFGIEAARMSGAGHLLSFTGTDTIPAIDFLEEFYNADAEKELIGGSVPATEHSVMCAGGKETERDTYKRLITEVYPNGIVSIVSDTWDFWKIITETIPSLKAEILARNGKVVIRPDSGDPIKIIAGDKDAPFGTPENKGLIQCLWDTFGGTVTEQGFKVLDSHIGAIYGDSITLERQIAILEGLKSRGFASCNVVLGIGSYTYQHVTRDTFGFAMKSTYCEVNGEGREIFKQPKTDAGKNSHRGLIRVDKVDGQYKAVYPVTREEEQKGSLEVVFRNGKIVRDMTLAQVRANVERNLKD
jgi:nicotinamide phosphoribosyltransferase